MYREVVKLNYRQKRRGKGLHTTVTVLLNSNSNSNKKKFKVLAFNVGQSAVASKDVTRETCDNLVTATIQNALSGNNPPQVGLNGDFIEVSIKSSSPNDLFLYYRKLLHSCIPTNYTTGYDFYLTDADFESITGVSVKRKRTGDLLNEWVTFMKRCKDEQDYLNKVGV